MPSAQSPILLEEHPYGIALVRNGEVMLTPKRNELVLPNEGLAEMVACEFAPPLGGSSREQARKGAAQGVGGDDPSRLAAVATLPGSSALPHLVTPSAEAEGFAKARGESYKSRHITKLAYTAIDQVEEAREVVVESMLAYLHTDTICYMSEDPELKQYERKHWQPVIDWAEETFACKLEIFEGVMPGDQSEDTAEAISRQIESYNNWQLTALMSLATGFSSLLLALAVMEKRLDAKQAFECAICDEIYQNEQWGEDEEATSRREKLKTELLETEKFLHLI